MSLLEFHFDMTNISEIGALIGRRRAPRHHHRFCSSVPTEAPVSNIADLSLRPKGVPQRLKAYNRS